MKKVEVKFSLKMMQSDYWRHFFVKHWIQTRCAYIGALLWLQETRLMQCGETVDILTDGSERRQAIRERTDAVTGCLLLGVGLN